MRQTDALGRATFHYIAPRPGVIPTERELRWLKHIERHGPTSSRLLFEVTRDTHRCRDTALRAMKKLRAGGFLHLPRQQRQTAKADFAPFIYDLTRKALDYLKTLDLAEATMRPTGHWWHAYRAASFTGSLEVAASREGITYIPCHQILALQNAELAIPLRRGKLIPDQLFALKYPGGYRACLLEIDRSTEPVTSPAARKSLGRAVEQYREVFETGKLGKHYGLKANALVLWVFESAAREERFQNQIQERAGIAENRFFTRVWPVSGIATDGGCSWQAGAWRGAKVSLSLISAPL
ncbi:replication-relaxation family protein [Salipiger sp. P9]|uniref:replication-relaxation family protein n=1 Tax=Salipiger pentaromativorans TaxID=2943193 RepID=UPI0021583A65|nr:replication-relaxation family protein [Salipiger pentaromativorans]MCR8551153.1 replication-relaxation family protein [Salipiger pentaromativorans]